MSTAEAPKAIPDQCPWSDNDIWKLIGLLEQPENYKVLFGKREPGENTSGESKAAVYRRIAEGVYPDMCVAHGGKAMGSRVKSKVEKLTKTYQTHAKRLRMTGEGVGAINGNNDGDEPEESLNFYIMGEGPCVETPAHARNIWDAIEKEFIFFPALHRIFASRPNVTPIVLTTPLGPQGPKTVWVQPRSPGATHSRAAGNSRAFDSPPPEPQDYVADLTGSSSPSVPAGRSFGGNATGRLNSASSGSQPTPSGRRSAKPSTTSREALSKGQGKPTSSKKRSLPDTLIMIQRENLASQQAQAKRQLNIELRKQITAELTAGIWTVEQAREKLSALERDSPAKPAAKRQRVERASSPEWASDWEAVTEEEL